ncbi:cytochrome P450 [Auriscalpium vulgare]|uniref:Cytochrome P450 n=1 Tax=Auriscalpium vulgare TaxID=40419 RepID=A0ACB8R8G8_9AGAM|nr:cytochrome P450 [Auriscalpium vulgare]
MSAEMSTVEAFLSVSTSVVPNIPLRTAVLLAIVLVVTSIIPLFFRKNITNKDGVPIPPGPPRRYAALPKYPERILHKWAQQYGGLYTVFMGNQLTAVISDQVVARDLLVNNGAITSSRRNYFLKDEIILRQRAITGTPYNDKWRQHRRLGMTLLTPAAVESYSHNLDYEAHIMVRSLWAAGKMGTVPVDVAHDSGRYPFNNMFRLSFGTRTETNQDPLIERALTLANEFMLLSGKPSHTALICRDTDLFALIGPWTNAVDFVKPLQWLPTHKRARAHKLHDQIIDTYGALILRVQARMDAGEDVPDCLRYPDSWPSFTFNPDRYLGDDLSSYESANLADPRQRDHWAFGSGRRICPGIHVAEREMWLAMSRLMWAFEINAVPGHPISLEEYEGANGRTPMPFKVQLVPRHDRVHVMLEEKDEVSVFKI